MPRTPLYQQAESEMLRRIAAGEWAVGQRLGNEFELADEFGVSQGTMRRALISLEGKGHLARKPGRGTLVAEARPASTPSGGLLNADGGALQLEVHRAKLTTRSATSQEQALLGNRKLLVLERVLKTPQSRIGLEETALPASPAAELREELPLELEDLLEELGLSPETVETTFSADLTSMSESVTLACDRYTPLIKVERLARAGDGHVLARQVMRLMHPAHYQL